MSSLLTHLQFNYLSRTKDGQRSGSAVCLDKLIVIFMRKDIGSHRRGFKMVGGVTCSQGRNRGQPEPSPDNTKRCQERWGKVAVEPGKWQKPRVQDIAPTEGNSGGGSSDMKGWSEAPGRTSPRSKLGGGASRTKASASSKDHTCSSCSN